MSMSNSTRKVERCLRRGVDRKPPVLDIRTFIRIPWSTKGYADVVRHILGDSYTLSLVLIGETRARRLNRECRGKDYVANVLSFPLDQNSGEVFLTIPRIMREAKRFGLSPEGHAKFLLIHACLHLKGYSHGSTMERAEDSLVKLFHIR
jgi:rRNA maturation RNase YbeY